MKKADRKKLQDVIDDLDGSRVTIQRLLEGGEIEDGDVEYLTAAVDEISEAIGNIEWTV